MTVPGGYCTPDACTLPAAEMPGRLAEFDAAFASGLREAGLVSPTHARWVFAADRAQAQSLAGLLRREQECCSFFGFGQRADGDTVTVDVTVPPGQAAVLAALTGRAAAHLEHLQG